MSRNQSALLTDLYQLTMLQAYFDEGMADTAVFEFFVRALPPGRNFLLAAGLEQVLEYLEQFRVTIDQKNQRIRFHRPSEPQPPATPLRGPRSVAAPAFSRRAPRFY